MIRCAWLWMLLTACSNSGPIDVDGGVDPQDAGTDAGVDAGTDAGVDAGTDAGVAPEFLAVLDDVTDLDGLRGAAGGVKYLAAVAGALRAPIAEGCAFQNTATYAFHIDFLRSQPGGETLSLGDYTRFVLQRPTRSWWGGAVQWRPMAAHPLTGMPGVLAYTLYTEDSPGNRLVIDDVRAVYAALTACAPAFNGQLAFVPESNEQRQTAITIQGELAAEGIAIIP